MYVGRTHTEEEGEESEDEDEDGLATELAAITSIFSVINIE